MRVGPLLLLAFVACAAGCEIFCKEDREKRHRPPESGETGGDVTPPGTPGTETPGEEEIPEPEVPEGLEPRLDRVSFASCEPDSDGNWKGFLYVQGANADSGASVYVGGVQAPTTVRESVENDLLGLENSTQADPDGLPWLAYPVHVYRAYAAAFVNVPPGAEVSVFIENLDGKKSNEMTVVFPADLASLDRDGDNLPDDWEINGVDPDGNGPIPFLDLPALGADPLRPDIFVELDVMTGVSRPPLPDTYEFVLQGFRNGPILNPAAEQGEPLRENGIALHIDASQQIPKAHFIHFYGTHGYGFDAAPENPTLQALDPANPDPAQFSNFYVLKGQHFDADGNRAGIYHYGIWAERHSLFRSGHSDAETGFNSQGIPMIVGPGNDFFVSLGTALGGWNAARTRPETLMHEIGHNLSLNHNPWVPDNPTPLGHHSVMSYRWQGRMDRSDDWRAQRPILGPLYYRHGDGWEGTLGEKPVVAYDNVHIDYSEGMGQEDHANWATLDFRGPEMKGNGE